MVYVMDTAALSSRDCEELAALLPEVRRQRIAHMASETDRCDSVAAACLSLYALSEARSGEGWREVSLTQLQQAAPCIAACAAAWGWPVDERGKPFARGVEQNGQRWYVSLSHSHGLTSAAADRYPLGVDIQRLPAIPLPRLKTIARRFHPVEQEWLRGVEDSQWTQAFCRLWTCKESVIKLDGGGLSLSLSSFAVEDDRTTLPDGRSVSITVIPWRDAAIALARECME